VWGATLGGGAYVARSAVGEDAGGDLLYAGSASAVPEDLAVALARHGARIAMELDINPEWCSSPSRPGRAGRCTPGSRARAAPPASSCGAGRATTSPCSPIRDQRRPFLGQTDIP